MARHKETEQMWVVVTPLAPFLVSAPSAEEAEQRVLRDSPNGLAFKPYLAENWRTHLASAEEILHLSVWADNAEPLAEQPRRKPNPDQLRLV